MFNTWFLLLAKAIASTVSSFSLIPISPSDFTAVTETLSEQGLTFLEAGVQMIPSNYISLDEASAEKMQRLIDRLEELDDVLEVYHNWEE